MNKDGLDLVEVLVEAARKAADLIDKLNEEEEGPMAMPPPIVEELRQAIKDVEDAWSFMSPTLLTMLRLEMPASIYNAKAMCEDMEKMDVGITDPSWIHEKEDDARSLLAEEKVSGLHIAHGESYGKNDLSKVTHPCSACGDIAVLEGFVKDFDVNTIHDGEEYEGVDGKLIEEYSCACGNVFFCDPDVCEAEHLYGEEDEAGDPLAADPEIVDKFSFGSVKEAAEKNLRYYMENAGPVEAGQRVGLSIAEVIDRYNPQIKVKCPHSDDPLCNDVQAAQSKPCPHAEEHVVTAGCFVPCFLIVEKNGQCCKPVEEYNEEEIL